MQSRLSAAQSKLSNLKSTPLMNINGDQNRLSSTLQQENTNGTNASSQKTALQGQITTAKNNLPSKQQVLSNLQLTKQQKQALIDKVTSLLNDCNNDEPAQAVEQDQDLMQQILGELNNLDLSE